MANKAVKKAKGLFGEFKAFISRGNVLDMAVGVIIGGAFGAIVNALVNILLSLCTWAVPGGIKGLVTPLPAITDAQKGIEGIGQTFTDIKSATIAFAQSQGVAITEASDTYIQWQNTLLTKYTLHGTTYYYNLTSIIDWGTFINAIISFIIIAIVLFAVIKTAGVIKQKRIEAAARLQEKYYEKHPEERPAPVEPEAPKPTELDILTEIRDALVNKEEKVEE